MSPFPCYTPFWSIEVHHLMCRDQIWRMTSGTPMVRRPAGVPNTRCPGTTTAQAHGVTQAAIKGAALLAVRAVGAMVMASSHRMDPGAAGGATMAIAAVGGAVPLAAARSVPMAHFRTSKA